ncbi:MAG: general stress protein [Beijerinckiaceae bacterium]|nr:general stress protein [Beijerinckiaceae bacterium]
MIRPKRQKAKRGFAAVSPEKRRDIARKGGQAVKPENRAFAKDKELAAEAGRKGGAIAGQAAEAYPRWPCARDFDP